MKQCTWCGERKPLEMFPRKLGGYTARCKVCTNAINQSRKGRATLPPHSAIVERCCERCGQIKPIAEFPRTGGGERRQICTACCYPTTPPRERTCPRCGLSKPLVEFRYRDVGHPLKWCRDCSDKERQCSTCGTIKPVAEFYTAGHDRFASICKACARLKTSTYIAAHPEEARARLAKWKEANPERRRIHAARSYRNNRDKRRAYAIAHRDDIRAYTAKRIASGYFTRYRVANREQLREKDRQWRQKRPWVNRERVRRREARKRGAPVVEKINRLALIERDNWTCYLCGVQCTSDTVTLDHFIPLARGGSHTMDNLRVACRSCNSKKSTKLLDEMA